MSVRIGRVYDPTETSQGRRILVDRLWPRGMTKERADLSEWCRDVAPTTELRHWYGHDPARSAEFRSRYLAELSTGEPAVALAHLIDLAGQADLILLTATKDPQESHAEVLADLLRPDSHR